MKKSRAELEAETRATVRHYAQRASSAAKLRNMSAVLERFCEKLFAGSPEAAQDTSSNFPASWDAARALFAAADTHKLDKDQRRALNYMLNNWEKLPAFEYTPDGSSKTENANTRSISANMSSSSSSSSSSAVHHADSAAGEGDGKAAGIPSSSNMLGPDDVEFKVVTNDGSKQNHVWLVNVKEIFSKQLPKMPREYIVRLVMDRKHYSLLCIRNGNVIGGVCFRPYTEQRFAEIAFLAVSATQQVRGFGTLLMNHLKQYVKSIGLTHFLTYADNYAIGYFRKQGFTRAITMPRERWRGYIKDYDGGTLMECAINEFVDYLKIPEMIASQREFLYMKIENASKSSSIYPGLQQLREGRPVKDIEQVPGVKEAGWTTPVRNLSRTTLCAPEINVPVTSNGTEEAKDDSARLESEADEYKLLSMLHTILRQTRSHRDAWPFQEPVPDSVTDYLEVVQEPIDLSLIKKRLDSGEHYRSPLMLFMDLKKMTDNARLYNNPDTQYYSAANSLESFFVQQFKDEGFDFTSLSAVGKLSNLASGATSAPPTASSSSSSNSAMIIDKEV